LIIAEIDTKGLVHSWNVAHFQAKVVSGDEILEVNGHTGTADQLLDLMKKSQTLNIKMYRRKYRIMLDTTMGRPLGLTLGQETDTLIITDIEQGGLVEDWNWAHPRRRVQLGDEIVEVNGIQGTAEGIYAEVTKQTRLRMTLRRKLLDSVPVGKHFFAKGADKVLEETYWPKFKSLFIPEGNYSYPMPRRDQVPDLLKALEDVPGIAVHTTPGTTVSEGQGYAMFAAGMRKDVQTLKALAVAWQAAGQGFPDQPACGGCGAVCGGSPYGSCLCKTVSGAYMPGWQMPMDKRWKMGSAIDGDQDAVTGLIYLAELTDNPEIRRYAVRSIVAFVLEDIGHGNLTANSRLVPVVGSIPARHQRIYLWRSGTCGGGFDRTSHNDMHDLCISPGYFAPGQWRLFKNYLELHADMVPQPHTAAELGAVLESAIVWGYNTLRRIACPNGLVSNWWTLPAKGWPYDGELKCHNSGTKAGSYYSDASRIPWRVVLDYLWFPEARTPSYDEHGKVLGTWGAKEYANRWAGAWLAKVRGESKGGSKASEARKPVAKDKVLQLLTTFETCKTVPLGFTALPKNGWGSLPVVTTLQVPMDGLTPCTSQAWLDYLATITFQECVNNKYYDLGQEVIVGAMLGGRAWLPLERQEFVIMLEKAEGSELGIDLEQRGDVYFIKTISSGLIKKWNSANPWWQVLPGDGIIAVNGIANSPLGQIEALKKSSKLLIKLWRAALPLPTSCHAGKPSTPQIQEPDQVATHTMDVQRPTTTTTTHTVTVTTTWHTTTTTHTTFVWTTTTWHSTTIKIFYGQYPWPKTTPWFGWTPWGNTPWPGATPFPGSTPYPGATPWPGATLWPTTTTWHTTTQYQPGPQTQQPQTQQPTQQPQCGAVNEQCGGKMWKGTRCCQQGCSCKFQGPFYSQCVPPTGKTSCQEAVAHVMYEAEHPWLASNTGWGPLWPFLTASFMAASSASVILAAVFWKRRRDVRSRIADGYMPAEVSSPQHGWPSPR